MASTRYEVDYGYTRELPGVSFDEAVQNVERSWVTKLVRPASKCHGRDRAN
jgi:hypothetical protein